MENEIKVLFEKVEAEDKRQNVRLDELDREIKSFHSLAISVEKLAINMENMLKEQTKQGARLEKLEAQPAEAWNSVKRTLLVAAASAVGGILISELIKVLAAAV